MGNAFQPGPAGRHADETSPVTPGPLGTNGDAGDPATPRWFVGNTPGAVGHGDHADPNGTMCRARPRRADVGDLLAAELQRRRTACDTVRRELAEVLRIRAAYADAGLLRQAAEKDWSVDEYEARTREVAFGKSKDGQPAAYDVPMQTNAENCRITQNWSIEKYRSEGLPDVVRDAHLAHEQVHQASCRALPSLQYHAQMSFPARRSRDELKAYDATIAKLEAWLLAHCPDALRCKAR